MGDHPAAAGEGNQQMSQRNFLAGLALATTLVAAMAAPAGAQNYPERLVHIINPYPPGGSVDVMARLLAQKLSRQPGRC
jgi:tripartite-type tricarboxylate transporter receptor subunit TctC